MDIVRRSERSLQIYTTIFVVFLAFSLVSSAKGDLITVHIIPHSHCDPGWLKTYEEYYRDQVARILTGVVDHLVRDSNKTFNWAEISFFRLWWDQQSTEMKERVKALVAGGQLEFIGGGWVQNDEADASLDIVVNQVTAGHEYILRHFNYRPRIAWQVDPFGHSSLTPTIFAQMGYEALVINRIHWSLKADYKDQKNMEFVWRPSHSFGEKTEMMTHVLHTHYAAPVGFDWEENGSPINAQNVGNQANNFAYYMKDRAKSYKTTQLLVPWGDDFKFQNAGAQYNNMDQLIAHVNANSAALGIRVKYSTLSTYFTELREAAEANSVKFPVYDGDFFPYADNEDSYWTGYYTSRPALKKAHREAISILRAAEIAYAAARSYAHLSNDGIPWEDMFKELLSGRWDTGLMAHHDGITGTSRSRVVDDYMNKLHKTIAASGDIIAQSTKILLAKDRQASLKTLDDFKEGSSATLFDVGEPIPLIFQNPLGWSRKEVVSVHVTSSNVRVINSQGKAVSCQIVPVWSRDNSGLLEAPELADFQLYFPVEIPPLGLSVYYITKAKNSTDAAKRSSYTQYGTSTNVKDKSIKKMTSGLFIENERFKVTFGADGYIASIIDKATSDTTPVQMQYLEYHTTRSGAYIFRTNGQQAHPVDNTRARVHIIKGDLLQQVQVYFEPHIKYTLTLASNQHSMFESNPLQIVHTVRPSAAGREVIVRYQTDFTTDREFYSDNGMELVKRAINTKKAFEANYFPAQTNVVLRHKGMQLTVFLRQVCGVTSDKDGSIELMLHRHLIQDDGRGLSEAVQDSTVVDVSQWLLLDDIANSETHRHMIILAHEHPIRMTYCAGECQFEFYKQFYGMYSPLEDSLPHNVHLFSLKARDTASDDIVIRLQHVYERGKHPLYDGTATVELSELLQLFDVTGFRKVSMTLNHNVDGIVRPTFPSDSSKKVPWLGGSAPRSGKGDKQNSDEEGVFISKIALEEQKKKEEAEKSKPKQDRQNADEEGVFISKIALEEANKKNESQATGRKLLSLEHDSSALTVVLEPLEIKSVLLQLQAKNTQLKQQQEEEREKKLQDSLERMEKDRERRRAQAELERKTATRIEKDPFLKNYLTKMEVKMMVLMTVIGVGLLLGTYWRLTGKRSLWKISFSSSHANGTPVRRSAV